MRAILKYLTSFILLIGLSLSMTMLNVHANSPYNAITDFVYTSDIDFKSVFQSLKPYLLMKYGWYCGEEYTIQLLEEKNNVLKVRLTDPSGTQSELTGESVLIDSKHGSYIMGVSPKMRYAFIYVKNFYVNSNVVDCFKEGWGSKWTSTGLPIIDNIIYSTKNPIKLQYINYVIRPSDNLVKTLEYIAVSEELSPNGNDKPNIDDNTSNNIDSNQNNTVEPSVPNPNNPSDPLPNENNQNEITPGPNIPGQNLPGQNNNLTLTNFLFSPLGGALLCGLAIILGAFIFKIWDIIKAVFRWLIE